MHREQGKALEAGKQLQQERQRADTATAQLKEHSAARADAELRYQELLSSRLPELDQVKEQLKQAQVELIGARATSTEMQKQAVSAGQELRRLQEKAAQSSGHASEIQRLQKALQAARDDAGAQARSAAAEKRSLEVQLQATNAASSLAQEKLQQEEHARLRSQQEAAVAARRLKALQVGRVAFP